MLLKVLKDYGAYIDEFDHWQASVDKQRNRVSLRGQLQTSGRRRIMSLINIPASPTYTPKLVPDELPAGGKPEDYTTQQYFSAVHSYVDDFRHRNADAKTLGEVAMWLDKYARKIDRLPMKGVYEEVLAYSQDVSTDLRDAAMAVVFV